MKIELGNFERGMILGKLWNDAKVDRELAKLEAASIDEARRGHFTGPQLPPGVRARPPKRR